MEVRIPDIGDFAEVAVIEVLVSPGDAVAAETPLLVLESDKATMDVPSPAAGVVSAVLVKVGDKVAEGTAVVSLDVADDGKGEDVGGGAESQKGGGGNDDSDGSGQGSGEGVGVDAPPANPPLADSHPPHASHAGGMDSRLRGNDGGEEELRVPDIGDFKDVAVIDVLVKPGDVIVAEQSVIVLESDKATMDVPASAGGTVAKVHIKTGDKINVGDVICTVTVAGSSSIPPAPPLQDSAAADAPPASLPSATSHPPHATHAGGMDSRLRGNDGEGRGNDGRGGNDGGGKGSPLPTVVENTKSFGKVHAGPAVRRFARELGVDLSKVRGSARLGRIVKSDVKAFAKAQLTAQSAGAGAGLPQMPEVDFAKFGAVEIHPLARVRKLSAANLHRNWLVAPHVTQFADADITEMDAFRRSLADEAKRQGYKMTPLAFLLKAAAAALREYPRFNASLAADGENLVMKKYCHIGVAVDTPDGLVVPVLRDVDRKGLNDLARELAEVSARAREGKLKSEEMRGGCFTISSLGGIGGAHFTPIINLPEAAILGVGKAQMIPKWNGKEFHPRLSLPLALSYDHRIIDGAEGARFITHYANLLTDTRRLAL